MTTRISINQAEKLVGCRRQKKTHVVLLHPWTRQVYICHSHECLARMHDLRDCPFSIALDDMEFDDVLEFPHDVAIAVRINRKGQLAFDYGMPRDQLIKRTYP